MTKRELWEGMRRAMLTAADLGEGYKSSDPEKERPPKDDEPAHLRRVFSDEADSGVMVSLQDAVLGSPVQLANATYYGAYGVTRDDPEKRIEVLDAEPPEFGEEGVHYVIRRPSAEEANGGETYALRHGEVVAYLTTIGRNPPPALGFARRLHEKMVEEFGESPAPRPWRSRCLRSRARPAQARIRSRP